VASANRRPNSTNAAGPPLAPRQVIELDNGSDDVFHDAPERRPRNLADTLLDHNAKATALSGGISGRRVSVQAGENTAAAMMDVIDLSEVAGIADIEAAVSRPGVPTDAADRPSDEECRAKAVELFPDICPSYVSKVYDDMAKIGPVGPDDLILRLLDAKEPLPKKSTKKKDLKRKREDSPLGVDADRMRFDAPNRGPSRYGVEHSL
jgi:hypothetical protein